MLYSKAKREKGLLHGRIVFCRQFRCRLENFQRQNFLSPIFVWNNFFVSRNVCSVSVSNRSLDTFSFLLALDNLSWISNMNTILHLFNHINNRIKCFLEYAKVYFKLISVNKWKDLIFKKMISDIVLKIRFGLICLSNL